MPVLEEGRRMNRRAPALFALAMLAATTAAIAGDWPRFRGPNGSGVALDASLPVELSAATAAWTREVPFGQSSPIVARGTVFFTALDGDGLATLAYDARTGQEKWRRSVPRTRVYAIAAESGPAVPTPVADDAGVYSFFPEFGLVAYDFDGRERWRRELPPFRSFYGLASSPIVEDGVLVLLCDETSKPYILGLDAATGKELWRRARDVQAESWTTPVVHRAGTGQAHVIAFGNTLVDAYDPRTGEQAWRVPGFGTSPIASPVIEGDLAFVVVPDQTAEFSPPPLEAFAKLDLDGDRAVSPEEIKGQPDWAGNYPWLDVDGDGKATLVEIGRQLDLLNSRDFGLVALDLAATGGPRVLWREKKTLSYIATPILYRDVLFLVKDGGILTSYDPRTGAVLKRGRIQGATEPFFPSPVGAGGRLYLTSSTGTVAVVSAEAQWQTLAVNDLDEPVYASPAIADGRMFVRTRSKLYAFAGK
jgi:outer membrane protein assembly factor BamB